MSTHPSLSSRSPLANGQGALSWTGPQSGLLHTEVQHQRHGGQHQQQREGGHISTRAGQQHTGHRGQQGGPHQVEVHDGEVHGEMLGAVERGHKGGGDGGAGAVGEPGDAQARHTQGDGADEHGQ